MSNGQALEVQLAPADLANLRMGFTVIADDSMDRPVDLSIRDGERHRNPRVRLSDADLDLIEQKPEGLVCASTDGVTGWTVRVAS